MVRKLEVVWKLQYTLSAYQAITLPGEQMKELQ